MDQIKIAEKLKALRKERCLTQEELAEKLYVSAKSVSRWETGRNLPDISVLIEIADLYRVDIREIILCDRSSGVVDEEIKEVVTKVASYSDADKEATAKRTIIASVVGLIAFVVATSLLTFGSGVLIFVSLVFYAVVCGSLCYILFNSTQKYTEANRKRVRLRTLLSCVLISVAVLIFILTALTFSWFMKA